MNFGNKLKQGILFVDGVDPSIQVDHKGGEGLNKLIEEGHSTVMLDTSKIEGEFSLISFLGFGKTYEIGRAHV